ncbi:hepatic lectin-like [Patiria miniata]|uniref:C-type lectin domain-containing protein n=1 Tax=Patiria miniata TaxID=46514 RepID=A0A914AD27_PATMI|nr:hepatic lectin-like [Patiria miniata]
MSLILRRTEAFEVSVSAVCLQNWTQFQSSRYRFMNTANWANGQKRCQEIGAMLLVIESGAENSFIAHELRLRNMGRAWLGCTDVKIEGEWVCHLADGIRAMPYDDWKSGQPNNYLHRQHCADVISDTGKWTDIECYHERYAVCEINSTQVKVPAAEPAVVCPRAVATSCYILGADGRLHP